MAFGVVGLAMAQAEKEHADQFAGGVADGDLAANPAFSQALVVSAEGPDLAVRPDQAQHPEPDLASSQPVALFGQAMAIETGSRLRRFGVPAQVLAELTVTSEGLQVTDGRKQNRGPQLRHVWKAAHDLERPLVGPGRQSFHDCLLGGCDLVLQHAQLVEQQAWMRNICHRRSVRRYWRPGPAARAIAASVSGPRL